MAGRILPTIDDGNRPFWDGCAEGVLRLQRCTSCDHLRYPISIVCPRCLSRDACWEDVPGGGEVYSFGVFRHAYNEAWRDRVPYVVALVALDAGPTLISTIVDAAPEDVRVGRRVEVTFERVSDEVVVPNFRPADTGGGR
jgi:uncharacterized OB-fold protein